MNTFNGLGQIRSRYGLFREVARDFRECRGATIGVNFLDVSVSWPSMLFFLQLLDVIKFVFFTLVRRFLLPNL